MNKGRKCSLMDEETGLYYYGARYMNPVTSLWYGVDPLAEKFVTTGGYVYTLDNPLRLIDKDGKRPTGNEAALMARHVYNDKYASKFYKRSLKTGWKVSNKKTSISNRMNFTRFDQNGLQTQLYESKKKNGEIEYAYVYAGTNSIEDGVEDVAQVVGLSPQ